ncbi:MAG: hypothetical protein ACRYGK_11175 [Janthinobacterium lividum]
MSDLTTLEHTLVAALILADSAARQVIDSAALPDEHLRAVGQAMGKIETVLEAVHAIQPALRCDWRGRRQAELALHCKLGEALRQARELALSNNTLDAVLLLTNYAYHELSAYHQWHALTERDRLERSSA